MKKIRMMMTLRKKKRMKSLMVKKRFQNRKNRRIQMKRIGWCRGQSPIIK
jgi:hypothetical protein